MAANDLSRKKERKEAGKLSLLLSRKRTATAATKDTEKENEMGSSCVSFCFVLIVLIVSVFGTSEREKERKKERSAVLSSSSDLVDLFTVYSHTHRRVALHEEKRGGSYFTLRFRYARFGSLVLV